MVLQYNIRTNCENQKKNPEMEKIKIHVDVTLLSLHPFTDFRKIVGFYAQIAWLIDLSIKTQFIISIICKISHNNPNHS